MATAFLTMRFEEGEEVFVNRRRSRRWLGGSCRVGRDGASVRAGRSDSCGPRVVLVPPSISGFRRGKFSFILQKSCAEWEWGGF